MGPNFFHPKLTRHACLLSFTSLLFCRLRSDFPPKASSLHSSDGICIRIARCRLTRLLRRQRSFDLSMGNGFAIGQTLLPMNFLSSLTFSSTPCTLSSVIISRYQNQKCISKPEVYVKHQNVLVLKTFR